MKGWDFPYVPVSVPMWLDAAGADTDLIVATANAIDVAALARAAGEGAGIEVLIDRAPLHWYRVRGAASGSAAAIAKASLPVRYVAPATRGTMHLGAPLDLRGAPACEPASWPARRARVHEERATPARWFVSAQQGGVDVRRGDCGTGAGARIAFVDDDAAYAEQLDLDAEILVGVGKAPRAIFHGALLVAWAVGARRSPDGSPFVGVAPDASPRLYSIPKPGPDAFTLPLAIARAAFDGADVIVSTTFSDGLTSPMLDDALEIATRLGRKGRGALVLMATGRQMSSAGPRVHPSLTLALSDPASDPRVTCIAPSARGDGWFLWQDRSGKLHPFSNRGPAVRFSSPGDDVAFPFMRPERFFHAESSGATGIAAGVAALVVAANPRLTLPDLQRLFAETAARIAVVEQPARMERLSDPRDVLPHDRDRDGHNAKVGYGLLSARRACLAARDPIALALVTIGEDDAASAWLAGPKPYGGAFGRALARAALRDASLRHALTALVRHARLVAGDAERETAHGRGSVARQLAVLLGMAKTARPGPRMARQLARLEARARAAAGSPAELEQAFRAAAAKLWSAPVRAADDHPEELDVHASN